MAISRVASATATGSGVTSLAVNKPTGTVEGDVMLAFLSTNAAVTVTPPAGWTSLVNTENCDVFWKRAGASEASSYTFTFSSSTMGGSIVSYRGVSAVTAFDVSPTSATQAGGSGAKTIASITPSLRGCMLVAYAAHETVTAYAWTAPFTEVVDLGDARDTRLGIAEYLAPDSAARGATYTPSGSSVGSGIKGLMALRPAQQGWIG